VHDFWNDASCGEALYLNSNDKGGYEAQSVNRYVLEPYILEFADFKSASEKKILEVGVGLGADHQRFAESGAILYGVDLTDRAIKHTGDRLNAFGLKSQLSTGDAENLDFPDNFFDQVYSWGVLHHSPNTPKTINEVYRVLKHGGVASIMIYHKWSIVGFMLWVRYALLMGKPWLSLQNIYSNHLESPGTKAYSVSEAKEMFSSFSEVYIDTVLTHGDLLESKAGQRHRGFLLTLGGVVMPRKLIRWLFPNAGLFLLIKAIK
jgi:ubiquinone/menaquinone biosynthesis C-methylase UbiE